MAGKVLNIKFVARSNFIAVRQESSTNSATTHTIYRWQQGDNKINE